ncbi:hypothetical protein GOODEAATRI_003563 [Goodea atripinnis]|uniref:Uncharacterized protein n=1 Tax=Goodea atripinnis TaxID=208336 RepID=A0ABV0P196_9TELE
MLVSFTYETRRVLSHVDSDASWVQPCLCCLAEFTEWSVLCPLQAATMALVQALPISAEPHTPSHIGRARRRHQSGPSPPINLPPPTLDPMGSVSSLVTTRPNPYQDHRSVVELGGRVRRPTPGSSCLGCESPRDPLLQNIPPPKKQSSTSSRGLEKESGNGNYTYINEDYVGDWNDNHVRPPSLESELEEAKEGLGINGNVGGPPPRLIPVSGKLEKVSVC